MLIGSPSAPSPSSSFNDGRSAIRTCALLACLSIAISGCVESLKAHSSILTRLRNRGPVALSSDNPYLAANLLLSKEMELSSELKGFIEHRGVPAALEIEHQMFSPLYVHLYYPAEKQFYTLEETDKTWFIKGPSPLNSETSKKVSSVATFQKGPAQLPVNPSSSPDQPAPKPNLIIAPTPDSSSISGFESPAVRAARTTPVQPMSDAEMVSNLGKGHEKQLAEITPKGDIVHYVTYPHESLLAIARWYTLDVGNAGRIARINRLKETAELSLGDTIIIPSYLIRNKLRLTEEAAQRLITEQPLKHP